MKIKCKRCEGTGITMSYERVSLHDSEDVARSCSLCNGTGKIEFQLFKEEGIKLIYIIISIVWFCIFVYINNGTLERFTPEQLSAIIIVIIIVCVWGVVQWGLKSLYKLILAWYVGGKTWKGNSY